MNFSTVALVAAFILYPFKKKNCLRPTKAFGEKNNRENAAKLNEIDKKTVVLVAVGGRARTASDRISQATHECLCRGHTRRMRNVRCKELEIKECI